MPTRSYEILFLDIWESEDLKAVESVGTGDFEILKFWNFDIFANNQYL